MYSIYKTLSIWFENSYWELMGDKICSAPPLIQAFYIHPSPLAPGRT